MVRILMRTLPSCRSANANDFVEQRAHAFNVGVNGRADGEGFSGLFHQGQFRRVRTRVRTALAIRRWLRGQ